MFTIIMFTPYMVTTHNKQSLFYQFFKISMREKKKNIAPRLTPRQKLCSAFKRVVIPPSVNLFLKG